MYYLLVLKIFMPKNNKKQSFLDKMFGKNPNNNEEYYDDDELDFVEEQIIDDDEYDDEDEERFPVREMSEENEELAINLIDNGDELVAQASVPGINPNDIEIDISRETLTVETTSTKHLQEKHGTYLYEEIAMGTFFRSIPLPAEIDVEESTAEGIEGFLIIRMPKIDKNTKKKLSIKKKN